MKHERLEGDEYYDFVDEFGVKLNCFLRLSISMGIKLAFRLLDSQDLCLFT